jgi:acyl carrier protein
MEKLVETLCEILEVNALEFNSRFEEMPEWDSLNALSIIAILDSDYGLQIDASKLQEFASISDFLNYVVANNKK